VIIRKQENEMAERVTLASRTFELTDQQRFSNISGDHNPMHLDAVLARRTQGGAPVVHGVHLLLWALDALASADPELPPMGSLRARFKKLVYLSERTEVVLTQRDAIGAWLNISVAGSPMSHVAVGFGDSITASSDLDPSSFECIPGPRDPMDLDFDQMAGRSGCLAFATQPEVIAAMFPAAANWLGARRIAALAASTYLVGMVCPGLYSIFGSLSVETCAEPVIQNTLVFRVTKVDPRFRLINQAICGGGLVGSLESFVRPPPTPQAPMESLAGLVNPTEFAGSLALVVGGSRGLGELTAKLIAAGGGRVIITYRFGSADADKVADEIRAARGDCEILAYDVLKPAEEQLANLAETPTHVYYFATPLILRFQPAPFVPARFNDFLDFYVNGFWHLSQALRARQPELSIFYPSSVFVSERPAGMTEYAMAKSAGEALCADMNLAFKPLHVTVTRLPRLPTDQTASITPVKTASSLETMLPLVREVQSWPRSVHS
jgi:MaoC like domain/short chain dehydrogenase